MSEQEAFAGATSYGATAKSAPAASAPDDCGEPGQAEVSHYEERREPRQHHLKRRTA